MSTFSIDDQLVMMIDRLNAAINVCHVAEAPTTDDEGYPYATGYSRSAMTDVANDLSAIVKQMREEVDG
jgi:predicted cobalt transporter CbtA